MSQLKQFSPQVQPKFSGAGLPVPPVTGARIGDEYRNTSSYELFTCTSLSPEIWIGSQGTLSTTITSFSHPDLIAAYTMDNISGSTLNDESPNGRNSTFVGGSVTVPGKIGNSWDANGSTDGTDSTAFQDLGTLTDVAVCFWIKAPVAPNVPFQRDATGATDRFVLAFAGGSDMIFDFGDVTTAINGRVTFPWLTGYNNSWIFVVCQYESGVGGAVYINGSQVGSGMTGLSQSCPMTARSFNLMYNGPTFANTWTDGEIDQFRMFNRALTADERAALYNGGTGA